MFNLKSSGRKKISAAGKGILLIQNWLAYPTFPRDTDFEFTQNLQKQLDLIESLPFEIRKVITIRLHPSARNSTFDVIGEWKRFLESFPEITLDLGDTPIRRLVSEQALVIHCYDSTGMLETFAENIPSMAFVPGGLEHLNDVARIRYLALQDVGLLYISSQMLSESLCRIYPNVQGWWKHQEVDAERKVFISSYSKISRRPARELAKVMKKLGSLET
jgi:putative transferase (TIGR04331 family)